MSRIDRMLIHLTRRLIAHEIPLQRLCWNPGLSPPLEMFLDGEITPTEYHRAIVALIESWADLTPDS